MQQFHSVTSGVHVLTFEVGQVYLWDWGDGITVVDTGIAGSDTAIVQALGEIGRTPGDVKEIVLTHFHDDHRGGAAALAARTGATVIAGRADAPVIRGEQPQPPPVLTEAEQTLAATVIPKVPPAAPVAVQREVEDGARTAGGGVIVEVPGHTPGSIALHLPRQGVLFTGDTIASVDGVPILGVFNIDRAGAIASLRKQARLSFEIGCVGHGDPIAGAADQRIRALAATL